MSKVMALVLAAFMALAVAAPAWAADPTGSITIKPSDTVAAKDKTLKAYKILDATYSGSGETQAVAYTVPASMKSFFDSYFSNKQEGDAYKTASQLAAAEGKTLDAYVMEQMKNWKDDASEIKDFSVAALAAAKAVPLTAIDGAVDGNNIKFSGLAAGYYVIEDTATAEPVSAVMLDTVTDGNVDITLKASDETKKEVMTAGDLINSKANELGLGKAVNYKVTQKIPNTAGYDYFYYMINDTLSTGLTFNNDVKVYVDTNGDGTFAASELLSAGTDYFLYADKTADAAVLGDKTFIIAFKDVVADIAAKKYKAGDSILVTYSATVNSEAVTGVNPNKNEVNVQYSNNPNKDQKGDFDNNHPGIPANDGNHPTGEGPKKYTDTYTTEVKILKTDGKTKQALPGVEFTLTGTSKDAVFNAEEVYEINPTGTYWLLKNGKYTTTAPTTAPTVQETTGGAGWVEMSATDNYAGADIRVVGDKKYRPYVEATDSALTRYVIVEANTGDYTSTTTKYAKVTKTSDAAEQYKVSRTGITGSDGTLDFSQLGAGTYKLSETGVLAGYNGLQDIEFTVTCTLPDAASVIAGTETATWNITTSTPGVTFTQDPTGSGKFTISLENNQGQELPSTGGMGTRILYTIGGAMIVAGGIYLVAKRRLSAME